MSFTQPIEQRINEMISGVRADVAVKLFGDDFDVLKKKAEEIERRTERSIDGRADVNVEQISGQPVLQIKVDQDQIARYGVPAQAVLDLVESVGGKPVGDVVEGQLRFPLAVRLPERYRTSPETIGAILLATPSGERIPAVAIGDRAKSSRAHPRSRANGASGGSRCTCNVRGRDLGSFVAEARRKIGERVPLPPGRYHFEWGGQFENLERARTPPADRRARWPLALIFVLLYLTYRNVVDALRGVHGRAVRLRGRGVRPVAAGHAVFDFGGRRLHCPVGRLGARRHGPGVLHSPAAAGRGWRWTRPSRQAAVTRLRPVLMTTLVASLGFVPMALSTGVGAKCSGPWPRW